MLRVVIGIAALFEGLFRQLVHSIAIRYVLATVVGAFWIAYFCLAGRPRRRRQPSAETR